MHQVIIIEPVEAMREILTLNLDNYLGIKVIPLKNAVEAIAILTKYPTIPLIITRSHLQNEETALKIFKHKKENLLPTELIILGDTKHNELLVNCAVVPNPADWKATIRITSKVLGITAKEMATKSVPEFYPMKAKFLLVLDTAPCDIYIRIKKDDGLFQYVKRIHDGDAFNKDDIARYITMGLSEFYVSKDFRLNITNIISDHLVNRLAKDISDEERVDVTGRAFDFVNDQIREIGFGSTTTQLVEGVVGSMAKTIAKVAKKDQVYSLIRLLLSNNSSFAFRHAHMTSVIASSIIKNSEWGNEEQVKKIAFVSFFHDIALTKDDHLRIHSAAELSAAELPQSEHEKIISHASDGANLMISYPDLPMGAEVIIKQHHGVVNGYGFTNHVSPGVSPLACVFVVAEEFVVELLKKYDKNERADIPTIIGELKQKLTGAAVKKAILVLENSFKKD